MNTNQPWILLLWGAPAAGKSTLCEHLKTEYQHRLGKRLCHLGTDRLNQAVLDDHFEAGLRHALYEQLIALSGRLLADGRPLLLEGTFLDDAWRQRLAEVARHQGARLLSVQLECRLSVRAARNQRRPEHLLVPDKFLRQSHHRAKSQLTEGDFVFDTEVTEPGRLANFLLDTLGVPCYAQS